MEDCSSQFIITDKLISWKSNFLGQYHRSDTRSVNGKIMIIMTSPMASYVSITSPWLCEFSEPVAD